MKRFICLFLVPAAMMNIPALCETIPDTYEVINRLAGGNKEYLLSDDETISQDRRTETARSGQHPYAL